MLSDAHLQILTGIFFVSCSQHVGGCLLHNTWWCAGKPCVGHSTIFHQKWLRAKTTIAMWICGALVPVASFICFILYSACLCWICFLMLLWTCNEEAIVLTPRHYYICMSNWLSATRPRTYLFGFIVSFRCACVRIFSRNSTIWSPWAHRDI